VTSEAYRKILRSEERRSQRSNRRFGALLAAALAATIVSGPAAGLAAPPEGPFETVPLPAPRPRHHAAAYACLAGGAGLVASSFLLANHADRAYDEYLTASTPDEIERRFGEATRYDRWSSGALLGGEALFAAGLYLRFLRRPSAPVSVSLVPGRCVVAYRF